MRSVSGETREGEQGDGYCWRGRSLMALGGVLGIEIWDLKCSMRVVRMDDMVYVYVNVYVCVCVIGCWCLRYLVVHIYFIVS